ncbi:MULTISPECIES: ClpX C4-type zinc finger protein [unclassified Serratia (in: enterobacteria)]|uniref:ClpX C4-type zinc finger protein n=1 Tax=unclassified Serratia (in: enterobacteria) TaxID=2647522 RepID=UPI0030765697
MKKLAAITSRLQSIMLNENITPNELVGCARVVRRSHQDFEGMSSPPKEPRQISEANTNEQLQCGFCGKFQHEVRLLILGQGRTCICNECVEVCDDVMCTRG